MYFLNKKGKNFEYTEEEYTSLVKDIQPIQLFQDLVKICMKKAYDTNINIERNNPRSFYDKPLDSEFLRAKKTEIRYSAGKYLITFLTSHLVNDLAKKKLLIDKKIDFIIEVLKNFEEIYKRV